MAADLQVQMASDSVQRSRPVESVAASAAFTSDGTKEFGSVPAAPVTLARPISPQASARSCGELLRPFAYRTVSPVRLAESRPIVWLPGQAMGLQSGSIDQGVVKSSGGSNISPPASPTIQLRTTSPSRLAPQAASATLQLRATSPLRPALQAQANGASSRSLTWMPCLDSQPCPHATRSVSPSPTRYRVLPQGPLVISPAKAVPTRSASPSRPICFGGGISSLFDTLDVNNDGLLSREEFAAIEKMGYGTYINPSVQRPVSPATVMGTTVVSQSLLQQPQLFTRKPSPASGKDVETSNSRKTEESRCNGHEAKQHDDMHKLLVLGEQEHSSQGRVVDRRDPQCERPPAETQVPRPIPSASPPKQRACSLSENHAKQQGSGPSSVGPETHVTEAGTLAATPSTVSPVQALREPQESQIVSGQGDNDLPTLLQLLEEDDLLNLELRKHIPHPQKDSRTTRSVDVTSSKNSSSHQKAPSTDHRVASNSSKPCTAEEARCKVVESNSNSSHPREKDPANRIAEISSVVLNSELVSAGSSGNAAAPCGQDSFGMQAGCRDQGSDALQPLSLPPDSFPTGIDSKTKRRPPCSERLALLAKPRQRRSVSPQGRSDSTCLSPRLSTETSKRTPASSSAHNSNTVLSASPCKEDEHTTGAELNKESSVSSIGMTRETSPDPSPINQKRDNVQSEASFSFATLSSPASHSQLSAISSLPACAEQEILPSSRPSGGRSGLNSKRECSEQDAERISRLENLARPKQRWRSPVETVPNPVKRVASPRRRDQQHEACSRLAVPKKTTVTATNNPAKTSVGGKPTYSLSSDIGDRLRCRAESRAAMSPVMERCDPMHTLTRTKLRKELKESATASTLPDVSAVTTADAAVAFEAAAAAALEAANQAKSQREESPLRSCTTFIAFS
eukprot:TRINITY_DN38562_c0_g1_i1.p1 TRINITY_DN38562_c0_g1~~TRINITY_DN38562_c0_g1_i1.p1  ORF type:complete len:911 (+),score=118.46 TRINITY_DN38562_c0_g1_i1:110-2842(+)